MRYLFCFLIVFLPLVVSADSFRCVSPIVSDTESFIYRAQSAYAKVSTVKARFMQESYLASLDISELSTGLMWFDRSGKMKWHYDQPEEQVFLLENNTVRLYQVPDKQVIIQSFSDVFLSDLPVSFLLGVGNLSQSFSLEKACKTTVGTLLFLRPLATTSTEGQELSSFELLVDNEFFEPLGARILDISGNVTKLLLSERERNIVLSDTQFALNYPPGTDIQDRREEVAQ